MQVYVGHNVDTDSLTGDLVDTESLRRASLKAQIIKMAFITAYYKYCARGHFAHSNCLPATLRCLSLASK